MKKTYALVSLLLLAPVVAQAQEEGTIETAGEITVGIRQGDVDTDSSKFNEYRDIDDGFYLDNLWFWALDPSYGRFLNFQGDHLLKDDQSIRFEIGGYNSWNFVIDRNEIPHNLSNKAMTPFFHQGNGILTLPSTAPIPNTFLAPTAAQAAAGALRDNDAVTASWLSTTLHKTDLGTQRDKTGATLSLTPFQDFKFRLSLTDERKDGTNLTYGPIGDRPPRTLNVQLAEPIDYKTQEIKFEAEYNQPVYQALFTYLLSGFENDIDTLRWQNPYVADINGDGFDSWNGTHNIASFGQRALAPDNRYQNASLALGFDLPMASRLNTTVAYGIMDQDETLLPYSSSNLGSASAFSSTARLPRTNSDTEINTTLFNADYSINPIERLNLRAFVRYYDLDNDTPESNWRYITSDTVGAVAGVGNANGSYKNSRVNLAYAFDQMNYGLESSYNLPFWRTALGLGVEREDIDRDYREANTEENIFKGSVRTRPIDWLTLRAKYLYGDRDGDDYNNNVTAQSYWYTTGTDLDNPKFTFSNHPDMRKFDVSDRERDQFDLAASFMPMEMMDVTASYRYRNDDYDSNVASTQPLLGNPLASPADQVAATPGDQLGLLESESHRYGLDGSYAPTDQLTLNAFGSRETIEATQRGLEHNENNKLNPTVASLATSELGPWTREASQWMAVTDDRTNTIGVGAGYELIPGILRLASDYSYSQGKVDIDYSGFGTQSSLNPSLTLADTYQFAFRDPETVTHKQYNFNASLEYKFVKNLVAGVHYIYDRYKVSDWMQEANTPWVESVGSEYLLRDTSSATSTQWGNRLISQGSYLGPGYEAHFGAITLTYRF